MTTRYTSLLLALLLLMLGSCDSQQNELALQRRALQTRTRDLADEFQPCPRTSTSTMLALRADSRCLVFKVAENPAEPDGRQLSLQVMVVPAVRALPEADPFVILVGGPGEAATVDGLAISPVFQRIREDRDILLVDQRGTGALSPLDCELPENDELWDAGTELLLKVQSEFLQSCLASIDADPRFYTTDLAVADLEAIREYLGYSQLNLWGGSYGTRMALMYLKYQPDHTRTVVIDGVAPPGILPLEAAHDAERALQRTLALCREEVACNREFPQLQDHYDELMTRYVTPQPITLVNRSTGESKPMLLSTGALQAALFSMLYSRESARLIPLTIERAHAGDFSIFGALNNAEGQVNTLMHFSVICSEDIPLIDTDELQAAGGSFVYDSLVQPRIEGCKVWPSRQLPADFFEPVVSDKPVLLFSATQDPVTPKRWADQVAATLSNAVSVEARGIGHGVFSYGCAADLIADVVERGSVQNLDTACLDELGSRPFFVNLNGSVIDDDQGR